MSLSSPIGIGLIVAVVIAIIFFVLFLMSFYSQYVLFPKLLHEMPLYFVLFVGILLLFVA
jgi:hypothetical protein